MVALTPLHSADPPPPRSRFALPEFAASVLAVVVAHAFFLAWLDVPILHDAAGYLRAAEDIAGRGLFSQWELSNLRTYMWPWLLSGGVRVSDLTGIPIRWLVFYGNLFVFVGACLAWRRALASAGATPRLARLGFFAIVLNPLVLIYPGYLLTESLSFSLIVLLLSASVVLVSPAGRQHLLSAIAAGSLLLGIAIMTRPGNLALAPVWAAAVCWGFARHRPRPAHAASACAIALALLTVPMVPQFVNNVRHYGRATVLPAEDFTRDARVLGVRAVKYATSHIAGTSPQVFYDNPLYGGEALTADSPLDWYWRHPVKGAGTIGLHVFNMLDQDLPFPYNPTLAPAYYPAAAFANMVMVALGAIGLVAAWRRARVQPEVRPYLLLAGVMLACQMAMHMFFAVEARWGVPSLMVLYAFAVFVLADRPSAARPRSRGAMLLIAAALAVAALPLSLWVRAQAPQIRAATSSPRISPVGSAVAESVVPGRLFESGSLRAWTLHQAGVGPDREAILFAPRAGDVSALLHRVRLDPNADYQVEFEAQAVDGVTAELSVDLYEGAAYDRGEQNTVFTAFEKTYTRFTARWNSGPDAPPEASLRFVTLSMTPIQIRHIVFTRLPRP